MNTAVLMFISHRYVEQAVMDTLAAAGYDDITLAQARVFARVTDDGIRLTALAAAAQVTKQTAGFLVDQLEAAGYVDRTPDPADGRARLVRIAPRGREVQQLARGVEQRIERQWTRHLGSERMRALRSALEDLREITDPFA